MPEFHANPYPFYRRLREEDPVHASPLGIWVLTRYDDCLAVYRDTETWSSDKKLDFRPNFSDNNCGAQNPRSLKYSDSPRPCYCSSGQDSG